MIDLENALRSAISNIPPHPPVSVPLMKAGGKILAETVASPVNIPNFTKSAIDGYAIFSEDAKDKKAINEVVGSVLAGQAPNIKLERGQAVEIQAEAPVPKGCDAVVAKNDTRVVMDGARVGILKKVRKGQNIRVAGEVLKKGDIVLKSGQCLKPTQISMLSRLGVQKVNVFPTPRIGIFAIGGEFSEWGKPKKAAQFWDANGPALFSSLYELGTQPHYLNTVEENVDAVTKSLQDANHFSLLIITGMTDEKRRRLLWMGSES